MIEDILKAHIAAIEENTAVLRQILAASGGSATAPAETQAPAKAEKPKAEKKEKPAPAPKEKAAPAPVEKDPDLDGDDDEELTHEVLVAKVQERLASAEGADLARVKEGFKALREKFEVKTIKDLTEDQFASFAEGIAAL